MTLVLDISLLSSFYNIYSSEMLELLTVVVLENMFNDDLSFIEIGEISIYSLLPSDN
jgi:hypothetical protein